MARSFCGHYIFIDYATQIYLVLMGLLVLGFHHGRVPGWPLLILAHAISLIAVHALTRWHAARTRVPGWGNFLRYFYPMLFYIGFYRESAWVNQMFFVGYLDPWLVRWEGRWFGCQPSLAFMEWLPNLVVSEVFYASYFSYYLMIFGVGIALFRQDRARFLHYLSVVSFVFYVCYVLYAVLPVIGPPVFFMPEIGAATLPVELRPDPFPSAFPPAVQAGWFFHLMGIVYQWFESPGAAFPSSHVAVAMVTLFFTYRYLRPVWGFHLVLVILLCLATVYCRYHYVVDVLVGLAAAAVLLPLGHWLYRRFPAPRQSVRS